MTFWNGQNYRNSKWQAAARGRGTGRVITKGPAECEGRGNGTVLYLGLAGVAQLYESDKTQSWILKRVNICKLYLSLEKTIKNVNS